MNLKVIAFDADDTLFVNEPYFQETETKFCALMSDYLSKQGLSQELFK
ncbi:MAG: HAD family hydrolase, partial [Flavobacterium sp.]|nr:HAD family hydrolase [Flavobacterium sp.]